MKKRKIVKRKHVRKNVVKTELLWLEATVKVRYIREVRVYPGEDAPRGKALNMFWPSFQDGVVQEGVKVELVKVIETTKKEF